MCEAASCMLKNGQEELLLEDVDIIAPEGSGLRLISIFGEHLVVKAAIHQLNLVDHKIILIEN